MWHVALFKTHFFSFSFRFVFLRSLISFSLFSFSLKLSFIWNPNGSPSTLASVLFLYSFSPFWQLCHSYRTSKGLSDSHLTQKQCLHRRIRVSFFYQQSLNWGLFCKCVCRTICRRIINHKQGNVFSNSNLISDELWRLFRTTYTSSSGLILHCIEYLFFFLLLIRFLDFFDIDVHPV